jgi:hypothetical protein
MVHIQEWVLQSSSHYDVFLNCHHLLNQERLLHGQTARVLPPGQLLCVLLQGRLAQPPPTLRFP